MKLLVIGAGMMGSAAAYDMARSSYVKSVTLADADLRRAKDAAARINKLARSKKVRAAHLNAAREEDARKLMRGHDAALSAVPYFFNLGLALAAIDAGCHFADLGGNNTVVRKELGLSRKAEKRGVAIAPDCGLSPGLASILAGELMRRIGGRAQALKIYVGGLPANPKPPFEYQLVFSVEGLINEYVEPAKVLRDGKVRDIEPLTEPETFQLPGFPEMIAFHTSGGTSTLPETFVGRVGECFEKTLRYPKHFALVRSLYDLGLFSSERRKIGNAEVSPRELMSRIFEDKFGSDEPDVCILRVEAHELPPRRGLRDMLARRPPEKKPRVLAFTMVDRYDPVTRMTAMMRTTAWPASIVTQMLASGAIRQRGGIRQEQDVPAELFLREIGRRGVRIEYSEEQ
jgi:lysine 6-dehydrogenase